jgi:hypothetical protein
MVERQPPGRPSRGRAALAGVAAAAALVLVALTARAGSGAPGRPPGFSAVTSAASSGATVMALAILPIAAVGGVVALFALQLLSRRRRDDLIAAGLYRRPSRVAQVVVVASLVAIAYLIHRGAVHLPQMSLSRITGDLGSGGHPRGATRHVHGGGPSSGISTGQWIGAVVCWLVLAAAGLLWWRRRPHPAAVVRRAAEPAPGPAPPFGSIDEVRAEPDPTRAVIGAYALMERTLDTRGAGRRSAEAPIEYLGRIGRELPGSADPAGRLTRLFLRARFAGTGVGRPAKAEAIDALEQLEERTP